MGAEWTEAEVKLLRSLAREVPASVSDVERWRIVSRKMGSRSKGECYRKHQVPTLSLTAKRLYRRWGY